MMPSSALAQEHGHRGFHEFHEHDVRRFAREDLRVWRTGGWRHELHNGRSGWWWVVGGTWYYYDAPVYPYPLTVSGLAFAEPVVVVPPAPVVVPGTPTVIQQPPPPATQPPMWYYCDNPAGYYPNVPTCNTPFHPVPAKPPQ
ncbi:hypothetical protein [Telmatospirillum sp.]|uniref:hypothetical protein n=1 Tax=Telmatospirillum sp. TaxID=2079197 RepID=UPI0028475E30|nr:hypothetical protein [Telmatospirillum sp.]MDR3439501.1 hypothetical protein [Telmatospirillum sp.]